MSGDPRVLAPLQQAFKETEHYDVQRKILYAWVAETGQDNLAHVIESEIRAWTPPPAEPSLDERLDIYGRDITELAATANDQSLELADLKASLERHLHRFAAFEFTVTSLNHAIAEMSARIPEPTAPSICSCLKPMAQCQPDGSACVDEPTAPDDPVCVTCGHEKQDHRDGKLDCDGNMEGCNCLAFRPAPDLDPVRVEAAAKAAWERVRGQSDREWEELPLATRNLWINDAESFIRAYLKDGGA